MSSGQGKLPLEVVTDNALLRSKYEGQELGGLTPLYITSNSAQGIVFDGLAVHPIKPRQQRRKLL